MVDSGLISITASWNVMTCLEIELELLFTALLCM